MKLTTNGLRLLKHFEGLSLAAYRDPVGVWTVGYGHTATARPGMTVTEAEAEALLIEDLGQAGRAVRRLVTVPLVDHEYSALTSFTFNLGAGNLAASTLLARLNRGDRAGAADEFPKWRLARGRVLPGLVRRRAAERHLFLTGAFDPAEEAPAVTAEARERADFAGFVEGLGLRHFRPHELLVMGDAHARVTHPGCGQNRLPPRELWPNIVPAVRALDQLRERLGAPVRTLSVYRSPAYNRAIGGAARSQHLRFSAIDFAAARGRPADWAAALRGLRQDGLFSGGIGTYGGFVHLDGRGRNADWTG